MSKQPSNSQTILFVIVLCTSCAFVLATLSSMLKPAQEKSEILDKSKQMLISAKIFDSAGYFILKDENNNFQPAKYSSTEKKLKLSSSIEYASSDDIFKVYNKRIIPFLIDEEGNTSSFEKEQINMDEYLATNKKRGYANLPWKVAYKVVANGADKDATGEAYVIPVSGFGLWDAIYGFITIKDDGNTVIGISWYEHKETPGLGANISLPKWQRFFPGKTIFQAPPSGAVNFEKAPMGITVVRGKVTEAIGDLPKANSAVDGMAGATLTGNGVTKAYKETLTPYRNFLINLQKQTTL